MISALRLIGAAWMAGQLLAATAGAQTIAPADPVRTPGWVFTPSVAASTAWDDNVVLAGRQVPTASDQVTLLSGTADGQYKARHSEVSFGYNGSLSAYRQLTELNSFDQHLRLDSKHQLSPHVSLQLHEGFSKVPTTDYVELEGLPFLRAGSLMDDVRATLSVAVAPHTTVAGGYAFEWVKFDTSTAYTQFLKGGHSNTLFASVTQQVAKQLSIGGTFSFRRADIAQGGGQFDISETAATLKYQASETLTLSASGGFSRLGDSVRRTSQFGPVWGVSATQQLRRASVSGSYVRSYVPSFGLGGTLQNQEFDFNFTMPFAKNRLYWTAGTSWRRNEPLTPGDQSLKSLWLETTGGYSIRRWLRLEAYFWRTQQDSQLPGGRVDRDRVGIQIITSAPMRLK